MLHFFFYIAEASNSKVGILTMVGQEDTPKVGSLLPVGLSAITDRHNPNTKICMSNSRISFRVLIT